MPPSPQNASPTLGSIETGARRASGRPFPSLQAVTVFLGGFLLFQVELIVAKGVLPWFGGTPAVWTTCMLFFQTVLVGGYAYAHSLMRLRPAAQVRLHVALVTTSWLTLAIAAWVWGAPVLPGPAWEPPDSALAAWRILKVLTIGVGLPAFLLSSTAPLIQAYARELRPERSPYRLYAVSNLGSLAGLWSYPLLVEPALPLRAQGFAWTAGYLAFSLALAGVTWRMRRVRAELRGPESGASSVVPEKTVAAGDRVLWLTLPLGASALLLAATNLMCQEVAVVPFLWVLPLSLYLLSFILCFGRETFYRRSVFGPALLVSVAAACVALERGVRVGLVAQIAVYSVALFVLCMVCHGELVALRPCARRLTEFYLVIAAGGAAGGVLVGFVAPWLFSGFWEFHLSLFSVCLLLLVATARDPRSFWRRLGRWRAARRALALAGLAALAGLLLRDALRFGRGALFFSRNFFGVSRVVMEHPEDPEWRIHTLIHGRIVHGFQYQAEGRQRLPTYCFREDSGIGLAVLNHPRRLESWPREGSLQIGVVGLGVGTLAAYARPGDSIVFYEINPDVVRLASPAAGLFTFLGDSRASVRVVVGDGRSSLRRELASGLRRDFDLLALDAFSSASIPVHLLTREAFALYLEHLRGPESVLAIHVTNRYVDLAPVIRALARHYRLNAAEISSGVESDPTPGVRWILLSPGEALLGHAAIAGAVIREPDREASRLWTDDYSNLFAALRR